MPVVAIGPISEPVQTLATLVAESQAFIDRCALESLTPADQVFVHALRPNATGEVVLQPELDRPFVLIKVREFEYNEFSEACMQPKSILSLHINDKYRFDGFQDAIIDFSNFAGQLLEDISVRNMGDDSLVMRHITQVTEIMPVERREEQDDYSFFITEYDVVNGADF